MKTKLMNPTIVWTGKSISGENKCRLVLWEIMNGEGKVIPCGVIETRWECDAMGRDVWCADPDALAGGDGVNVQMFHDLYRGGKK